MTPIPTQNSECSKKLDDSLAYGVLSRDNPIRGPRSAGIGLRSGHLGRREVRQAEPKSRGALQNLRIVSGRG